MFDDSGYNHPMPVSVGGGTKKGIQKNRYISFCFRIATCFFQQPTYIGTKTYWMAGGRCPSHIGIMAHLMWVFKI